MADEIGRVMVFERAGRSYAVAAGRVAEVAVNLHVTPVPLTGKAIRGLVPLHGHPLAIVDLTAWLSAPNEAPLADEIVSQMLVLEIDVPGGATAVRFAVIADRVIGYRSIPIESPDALPAPPAFVTGRGAAGTTADLQTVTLIDAHRLFEATLASMPEPMIAGTGA